MGGLGRILSKHVALLNEFETLLELPRHALAQGLRN